IHVKLLNGFPQPLTYKVPPEHQKNLIGSVVKVPLKDTFVSAYVIAQFEQLSETPKFKLKEMAGIEPFPQDAYYQKFINQLSEYYQVDSLHFVKRIRQFVNQAEPEPIIIPNTQECFGKNVSLTNEQQNIVNSL